MPPLREGDIDLQFARGQSGLGQPWRGASHEQPSRLIHSGSWADPWRTLECLISSLIPKLAVSTNDWYVKEEAFRDSHTMDEIEMEKGGGHG